MSSALLYLAICVMGYLAAIPLRKYKSKLGWFGKAQTVSVLCLVFAMGIRVGANEEVVKNLDTYGLIALVFTVIVLIFSIIAIHFARRLIGLDRYGHAKALPAAAGGTGDPADSAAAAKDSPGSRSIDKMTVMILISVCIGILSGYFYFLKTFGVEQVSEASSLAITVCLCILLVFIGLDLGLDGKVFSDIRRVGIKILLLPISVIVGTLVGAAACALFLPLALNESLAVGGGMAWYSLGAGILMDAGYEIAGAISFMHNIMRELLGIIFVPIIAKKTGYVESLALPASTCMDVCLPIVENSTNPATTVYSFITGFIVSMSVPFTVPLFLAL